MPRENGFTLIETLIASAVLIIFISAVLSIVSMITQSIGESRVRSMAIQLAQDRIEIAHNLDYEQIGVENGIPAGVLAAEEEVEMQGLRFTIRTSVLYVDDAFDDQAPTDIIPADYKRIRIAVTWQGQFSSQKPVVLMANISPAGLESDIGGGTLSVLVFNALGQPVSNAQVTITAASLTPPVDITSYTDVDGRVNIPGAPVCSNCYHVAVSKDDYTSDRTYGTDEVDNPQKPHLSILESRVSEVSFAIDTVSSLTIQATRAKPGYTVFPGVNLTLRGTKEIGRTAADEPVYKVSRSVTTGTGGLVTLADLEWDSYTIEVPDTASVDFAGSWPFNPVPVSPGQAAQAKVIVTAATENSLLVQLENMSGQPLESAWVEIARPGYIATGSTGIATAGDYSQAFFPGIIPDIYTVSMGAAGYQTATASFSLIGDKIEKFLLAN